MVSNRLLVIKEVEDVLRADTSNRIRIHEILLTRIGNIGYGKVHAINICMLTIVAKFVAIPVPCWIIVSNRVI